MTVRKIVLLLCFLLLVGCQRPLPGVVGVEAGVQETAVIPITLAGPLARDNAQLSGLAWYGDFLILLPQYPNFARNGLFLYALPKSDVLAYLDGDPSPLTPQAIPLTDNGLAGNVDGFEGYEAVAFHGDTIYLTVEANGRTGMMGYLAKGRIAPDLSGITLDATHLATIASQTGQSNRADEALLVADDQIVTLYEANGATVNESAVAHLFSEDLTDAGTLPMTALEYRVTDATEVDANGRFWVTNYFYPGDTDLRQEAEPLGGQFGWGASHQQYEQVERLVELQFSDTGITLTGAPPIQLQLPDDDARNWEGIVRLDERGFLLATDSFPATILGFVPVSED